VVTPVVDYARSRADVDPERIAICGASMGGYMVARGAAFEKRIAAVITDPGVWDVATPSDSPVSRFVRRSAQHWWRAPIDAVAAALAARGPRHLRHTLRFGMRPYGTGSLVEMLTLLREYNLDGIAERISCPLLVLDSRHSSTRIPPVAHPVIRSLPQKPPAGFTQPRAPSTAARSPCRPHGGPPSVPARLEHRLRLVLCLPGDRA
jgi:pimeloyl-ACP methyl ester carboxylesterase